MESVEKTGETIEAAIDAGLRELGVTAADVMVEVLEEPYRGIMGIGAKPARVRIIYMGRRPEPEQPTSKPSRQVSVTEVRRPHRGTGRGQQPPRGERGGRGREGGQLESDERRGRGGRGREGTQRRRGGDYQPRVSRYVEDFDVEFEDPEALDLAPKAEIIPDDQADEVALAGKQLLNELLEKMDIYGTVTIHKSESTREGEESLWILNISGEDAQPLIGRRGETLASLQYILRLMLSRKVQKRANIIVDVMEYKLRRNERLRQLATRMADQAVKQGRTVTLEPMPPNERRIIHLTLKERTDVETKSIGEGTGRKVTINPIKA
jgi:spoIIIJ-associated protein